MKKLFFILVAVTLILSGCGKDKFEPVAINEAKDKCDLCHMTVKDDAFATEIITKYQKVYKFDDLGCLFKWKNENKNTDIGAEYVRDHNHKKWVKLDEATYVYGTDIQTPMGYGIISFEKKANAEAYAKEHSGTVLLTSKELADHKWNSNMGHGETSEHDHMDSEHE